MLSILNDAISFYGISILGLPKDSDIASGGYISHLSLAQGQNLYPAFLKYDWLQQQITVIKPTHYHYPKEGHRFRHQIIEKILPFLFSAPSPYCVPGSNKREVSGKICPQNIIRLVLC
ncbi:hypothetical protein CDAR_169511 [Caerostris darwini]|uniref:Uncharacterized protein n=1 Tax=Caerostris darwini TaxID=1538125 RepID=A0AAV4SXM6_9ARAC|nr:hypothetical protein CDAR_169511 [Caerostris darwini]